LELLDLQLVEISSGRHRSCESHALRKQRHTRTRARTLARTHTTHNLRASEAWRGSQSDVAVVNIVC
jgi:hypothetical protein